MTSESYDGNLGGITGANDISQGLAEAASRPGVYKAWLSDDAGAPVNNFTCRAASCSNRSYILVDGSTIVASNRDDLTTCAGSSPPECLAHGIDMDETGTSVGFSRVWTNTEPSGNVSGSSSCNNWKSTIGPCNAAGRSDATSDRWTSGYQAQCYELHRLYCFQQA